MLKERPGKKVGEPKFMDEIRSGSRKDGRKTQQIGWLMFWVGV